jgi:glycosyltransferase involved in cell wall biosynthesis
LKTIAIDATSIVNTGGFTHLFHIIEKFDKKDHPNINNLIILGSYSVLNKLPDNSFIIKHSHPFLNKGKLFRLIFQIFILDSILTTVRADILLSLTGDYMGKFRPYVGISQNMLLYENHFWKEIKSMKEKLKLWINYQRQKRCFKAASGLIFISNYAKNYIINDLKLENIPYKIIHHGVSPHFMNQNINGEFKIPCNESDLNFIYVSTVHVYKNQWNVIDAIWQLRKKGFRISLTLIGPIIYNQSGKRLFSKMKEKDPNGKFIKYIHEVPYEQLPSYYFKHDAIIFASTCENMPNILIESMATGLPIACSDKEPMPEFLKKGGYYFNANSVDSIAKAVRTLIEDRDAKKKIINNLKEVRKLKWEDTSKKTFSFITSLKNQYV